MQIIITFYVVISFLTMALVLLSYKYEISKNVAVIYFLIVALFFTFSSGFKQVSAYSDMSQYLSFLDSIRSSDYNNAIENSRFEFGFLILSWFFSLFDNNIVFLLGIPALQISILSIMLGFEFKWNIFIVVLFSYVSYFLTYNLSTNIIRQGLALPFCLIAIKCMVEKRYGKSILFILGASLFHNTAFILLLPLFFCLIRVKLKKCIFLWLICLIFSYFNLAEDFMRTILSPAGLTNMYSHIIENQEAITIYKVGFRFDFLVFGMIPIVLWCYLKFFYDKDIRGFECWLSIYLVLNSISLLMSFMPFNDRIASYSWYMIPVVVGLSLTPLKENICESGKSCLIVDERYLLSFLYTYRIILFFCLMAIFGFLSFTLNSNMRLSSSGWL